MCWGMCLPGLTHTSENTETHTKESWNFRVSRDIDKEIFCYFMFFNLKPWGPTNLENLGDIAKKKLFLPTWFQIHILSHIPWFLWPKHIIIKGLNLIIEGKIEHMANFIRNRYLKVHMIFNIREVILLKCFDQKRIVGCFHHLLDSLV